MSRELLINIVYKLKDTQDIFSSREKTGQFFTRFPKKESLPELELQKLEKIINVLNAPELEDLISQGKVTLGIIKPRANEGSSYNHSNEPTQLSDDEAAQRILEEIGEDRVIFKQSVQLTKEQAAKFYHPIKKRLEKIQDPRNGTVWNSVVKFAASGPLTFLLIYDETGHAVQWWRNKMGKTNPMDADPNSIRGKHATATMLPNNLVHGSDSPDEVLREVGVLRSVLEHVIRMHKPHIR